MEQEKIQLNSKGVNAAIKAHILSEEKMREIGFTDFNKPYWYYFKKLEDSISFSVTIPKDGSDLSIDVLDEDFLQPYDYQYILEKNPDSEFAGLIQRKVEEHMDYLQNQGVLEGHKFKEYI